MTRSVIAILLFACMVLGCRDGGAATSAEPTEGPKETVDMKITEIRSGEWSPGLSDDEKATVFAIAEDTLEWCASGEKGRFSLDKYDITAKLKEPTHTFVTLKIEGMLRGCIGSLPPWPAAPLHESVHNNAVSSSLKDFRFRPVKPAELPKIDIHVSLLSPVTDIKSLDEFNIGEHGIILVKGRHRAVYLPEVATEQGWDKEETLSSLSMKAGMAPDGWREDAQFQVFSSVVLHK